MEFSTYIIQPNPNKTSTAVFIGVAISALLLGIACAIGWYVIAGWMFGVIVLVILLFALLRKGKMLGGVTLKNKLVVTTEVITIAGKAYEIRNIKKLHFVVHSFSGMQYTSSGRGKYTSDGMGNRITFTAGDEDIQCNFFLNSRKHTFMLCQVFEEWYKNKTPFVEVDMYNKRTYLFRPLDGKELEAFKEKYGYR